jgi:hypothetical protein
MDSPRPSGAALRLAVSFGAILVAFGAGLVTGSRDVFIAVMAIAVFGIIAARVVMNAGDPPGPPEDDPQVRSLDFLDERPQHEPDEGERDS